MASEAVNALTYEQIVKTARDFQWNKKMPKWTVIVDGRELPLRPLVLAAAGVRPNDPTNSHAAVAILESLGFETRYEKESVTNGSDQEHLGDLEDLQLAEQRLSNIRAGKSQSVPLEEVMKSYGLDDRA